jgi:hypothetical protein
MHDNVATGGPLAAPPPPPGPGAGSAFRRLYARAVNPEALIPGGQLAEVLRAESRRAAPGAGQSLDSLVIEAAGWSSAAAGRFRAVSDLADRVGRTILARKAALGWAPLGLAAGAWLQWLTSPGTADGPLFLRILALYASDVGVGHPGIARGSAYLGLLRQLRAADYAVPLARLVCDPRIDDASFRLPALLLAMSRRPGDFCPELIGGDLCLRAVGLPPPLALARAELQADWEAIDYSGARGGASPAGQCRTVAAALVRDGPESARRVYAGFGWTLAALRSYADVLHHELRASLDPRHDMARLLRARAREGAVYHRQYVLEGRQLTEWLRDCREDPEPFLDVLARSEFVQPGRSDASTLVGRLVSEQGPMFRIFSSEDLAIISRWIDALPSGSGPPAAAAPGGTVSVRAAAGPAPGQPLAAWPRDLAEAAAAPGRSPGNLREAYHLLMARDGSPELRDWCLRYVRGWLAQARHRMLPGSGPLPWAWTAGGLRPWLQGQHDQRGAEFERSAHEPLPPREALIDDTVQTAPLTLIDGSWLQGFTDYELASSDIGHSVFATYWDELGNGEVGLNHPLIYREVLQEMGVSLPPTASPEFARWPGFRDASFELPVYWLCIGRFPCTFLPEVLGLNLAMELSGVGGGYRRAGLALREYGFSTRFVDIHNTIDNVATGHSAWAADAVDAFMARLPDSAGPGGRSEAWERVRAGYRSLNPPGGLLARRAARRAGRRPPAAGRRHCVNAVPPMAEEHTGV